MTTTEIALPTTGDRNAWNEQEKALVEAAGLVRVARRNGQEEKVLADRPTVEAFLVHCRRTGLDPIARQIYAIYRGGKWGIQISIDGARLVAERTGQYEGQTPVQWTDDGVTWVDVWLKDSAPRAARVGVYRRGFREPLYAVANWDSYVVMKDVWERGQKTGEQVVSDMWQKFGPLMLGKCAEMLALRKAFPQDLSGLYTTEEMAQANAGVAEQGDEKRQDRPAVAPPAEPSRNWAQEIADASTVADLTALYQQAQRDGELGVLLGNGDARERVEAALWRRRKEIENPTTSEPLPGTEPGKAAGRNWVREARGKNAEQVRALHREAEALGAPAETLAELVRLADTAPEPDGEQSAAEGPWAPSMDEPSTSWVEVEPGVFAEVDEDEPSEEHP